MDTPTIFNLETVLSLALFFLIIKWYLLPWLLRLGPDESLVPLLLFSGFRFLGLSFTVPNFTAGLPAAFATPVARGDFIVAMVALIAAVTIKMRLPGARILAWIYAVLGAADFAYAGSLAGANDVPNRIGPLWPLMTVLGPAWMMSILFTFRLLIWPAPAAAPVTARARA
jgi:hypothetical protein